MKKIALFKLLFSVLCIAAISFVSCDRIRSYESPPNSEQPAEDEVEPTYTTPEQLAFLQAAMIDAEYINRSFMDMPGDVLYNVASVCINRFGAVTKKQVVMEYSQNQEIYNNLKSPPDSTTEMTSSPNELSTNTGTAGGLPDNTQLSRTEGDTIIGGVVYRKITYQYGNKSE